MLDMNRPANGIKELVEKMKERSSRLSPESLLRSLYREAMLSARKMGSNRKPDVPDRYVVQLNYHDWDDYFGCRQFEIESYLSTELHAKLSARQRSSNSRPVVELAKDYSLPQGEFKIKCSFIERAPSMPSATALQPEAVAATAECKIGASEKKASTTEKTPSFTDVMWSLETEVMKDGGRVAFLVTKAGKRIAVHAGDTIGVNRNVDERKPDIALDLDTYRFVSQIHGTFSYLNGWRFRDDSKNGTKIKLGRMETELQKGEWIELKDGCEIVFGHGSPLMFQCC